MFNSAGGFAPLVLHYNSAHIVQVFCVHGGIPMPTLEGSGRVTAINDIPSRLSDPVDQSPLAWDMLWNDPIR